MSRLASITRYVGGKPELIIEIILAITLGLFALYIGGPWYIGGPTTAIGSTIESEVVRFCTAAFYFIPSAITLLGLRKPRWRVWGVFGLFLGYLFSTILRVLTFGFTPVFWLFLLALASIAAVLYIVESGRVEEYGNKSI